MQIPLWFKIVFVIAFVVGVGTMAYTFKECGPKALLLGNGAYAAAFMGMCE